ncbi:MAG: hypothetical protein IAG10_18255, partial [Planctomycetaceae bacterium]|nr:hypothetical protein [Planctomycetaceae bacterium]
SKRNAWRVDLENEGEDPRWTVALRALFAGASAQASPFSGYKPTSEAPLPCVYLMDLVLAVRSDLTFFMAGRAWLNTNYHDFHNTPKVKDAPLLNGFMMLSVRQSRFLANLSSNPQAEFGDHPPVPEFIKTLLRGSRFTATLLIEPGLLHYELGWPNQLQANLNMGPLTVQVRAGQIMRLSTRELVIGQSFLARGKLELKAEFSAGFFGAGLYALADVAYGIRYIGVLAFEDTSRNSAFYGAVGLDIRVKLEIRFWLRIKLGFFKISINLNLAIDLQFTAALQVGISFPEVAGALGTATVSLRVMGRRLGFNVRVGINDGAVEAAKLKTERFLHIGLEAEDVEAIPGTDRNESLGGGGPPPTPGSALALTPEGPAPTVANVSITVPGGSALGPTSAPIPGGPATVVANATTAVAGVVPAGPLMSAAVAPTPGVFHVPDYYVGIAQGTDDVPTLYLLLVPRSPMSPEELDGFLAVPPRDNPPTIPDKDFEWTFSNAPRDGFLFSHLQSSHSGGGGHTRIASGVTNHTWKMPWLNVVSATTENESAEQSGKLYQFLRYAYVPKLFELPGGNDPDFGQIEPEFDPAPRWIPGDTTIEDSRVANPTTAAFEAAVRGAAEQYAAPYFKFDPNSPYDRNLREACRVTTSVYTPEGKAPPPVLDQNNQPMLDRPDPHQAASELRSSLVQAMTRDFFEYASTPTARPKLEAESAAFQYGLVFKITPLAGQNSLEKAHEWLESLSGLGTMRQRNTPEEALCGDADKSVMRLFNRRKEWFSNRPPEFARVRKFEHANTVAIDWRLEFPHQDLDPNNPLRDDPEHHLRHYVVRREHLDGNDPSVTFPLKTAEVLHRVDSGKKDAGGKPIFHTIRLPSRFQMVDHFADQNAEDVAALTANGKLYLYTITPIDVAGNASTRPLSIVAQRF